MDGSGIIPIADTALKADLRRKGRRVLLESAAVGALLTLAAAFAIA